jgi:hypothetical protein
VALFFEKEVVVMTHLDEETSARASRSLASPCAPDSLIGRFSSPQSFLRAIVYAPVWVETITRSVPRGGGTLAQYGVYLSALGPLRLPRPPVYYCTLLAASLYCTRAGEARLLAPSRTDVREPEEGGALCHQIQQQLFEAVLAYLQQSRHVVQVVPHASWPVPAPWSKVAGGFVYREGRWLPEEAEEERLA